MFLFLYNDITKEIPDRTDKLLMKFIVATLLMSLCAFAGRESCEPKSLEQRIKDCRTHLRAGFKEAIMKDQGLMNAQLNLTAYKLASMIYKKDIGEGSNALKQLGQELLNPQLIKEANNNSNNLQADINNLYLENNDDENSAQIALDEIESNLGKLTDYQLAKIISASGNESFNQNDVSMLWFVSEINKQTTMSGSYLVSRAVQSILNYHKDYPQEKKEQEIANNIAKSKVKLQSELYKIKNDIFQKNKCDCVGDYDDYENSQNNSILLSCSREEDEILNIDFMTELHDVLFNSPDEVKVRAQLKLKHKAKKVNSDDIRKLQDYLNGEDISNLDRIVNYYKTGLYEDNGDCQSFTVVDKKNQKTYIYGIDGEKIFETNAIMAKPRSGTNQVVFNPDSELREFHNGTYSRSTSAGIFYSVTEMDPVQRRLRKYDEEFNDRVLVLATRSGTQGNFNYDDKITIAMHGVPVNNYVSNARQRLDSFDGGNRNLSTGCVNIEGYAYDMINNLTQNHCPLYILPEDDQNYFHIKNRELHFSTDVADRKKGVETPKRCQGVVRLVDGKAQCTGLWVDDPKGNVNRYYYSPVSTKKTITAYRVGESSNPVMESLINNRDRLIADTNAQIDEEDFSDLSALTYALSVGQGNFKSEETFKDLYNAYYRLKTNDEMNFERMSVEEKRMTILGYYLDPSGFGLDSSSTYAVINRNRDVGQNLELASRVRFIYDY